MARTMKDEGHCAAEVHCRIECNSSYVRFLYCACDNDLILRERKATVNLQSGEYSSTVSANMAGTSSTTIGQDTTKACPSHS